MMVAALLYAIGAGICATALSMPMFLVGRLIAGLGGGALVSLAFVSVERLFPPRIWPQLFGIMSAIWGVAAFSGPLLGALVSQALSWRWAFGIFTFGGLAISAASFLVLTSRQATTRQHEAAAPPPFPFAVLATLGVSVVLIASAGVEIELARSSLLLAGGLVGLALFFKLDSLRPESRLFPSGVFDWHGTLGTGMTMVAAFSIATVSLTVYGPLLLTTLHGIPTLTAGYIIAAEAIAWSILSILVANTPPHREKAVILTGAVMIAAGLAGFAVAVPAGSIPLILFCALLQGGGFGIAWPFFTRIIVASAKPGESTLASGAVPTMQRIGYAVGAATAGIIANACGFGDGLSREAAADVALWVFLGFVPLTLIGVLAAARIAFRVEPTPRAATI